MKMSCFVREGELSLPGHTKEMIKQNKDGAYVMDLLKEKSKATGSMFGFLYGYVYPVILEEMGQEQSVEAFKELDRMLKERFGAAEISTKFELRRKKIFTSMVTGETCDVESGEIGVTDTGKPFVKVTDAMKPKSKADYTVQEMQDYWMALQKLVAEMWGRTLKDPDPNWKKNWEVNDGNSR